MAEIKLYRIFKSTSGWAAETRKLANNQIGYEVRNDGKIITKRGDGISLWGMLPELVDGELSDTIINSVSCDADGILTFVKGDSSTFTAQIQIASKMDKPSQPNPDYKGSYADLPTIQTTFPTPDATWIADDEATGFEAINDGTTWSDSTNPIGTTPHTLLVNGQEMLDRIAAEENASAELEDSKVSKVSSATQNISSNLSIQDGFQILFNDGTTDKALIGYHDYGSWKAVEIGDEEYGLTLNTYDRQDGTVDDHILVNLKNSSGALPDELLAYMSDVADLKTDLEGQIADAVSDASDEVAAEQTRAEGVEAAIEAKIPAEASATNQLSDKEWVIGQITTPMNDRGVVLHAYANTNVNVLPDQPDSIYDAGGGYAVGDVLFVQFPIPSDQILKGWYIVESVGASGEILSLSLSSAGAFKSALAGAQLETTTSGVGTGAILEITTGVAVATRLEDIVDPKAGDKVMVLQDETNGGGDYNWAYADKNGDGIANWIPIAPNTLVQLAADETYVEIVDGVITLTSAKKAAIDNVANKADKVTATAGTGFATINAQGITTSVRALQSADIPNNAANTSGNAGSATKLATARSIQVNLASSSGVNFDGSSNVTPGVSGILPLANGGTGTNNGTVQYLTPLSTSYNNMTDNQIRAMPLGSMGSVSSSNSNSWGWVHRTGVAASATAGVLAVAMCINSDGLTYTYFYTASSATAGAWSGAVEMANKTNSGQ